MNAERAWELEPSPAGLQSRAPGKVFRFWPEDLSPGCSTWLAARAGAQIYLQKIKISLSSDIKEATTRLCPCWEPAQHGTSPILVQNLLLGILGSPPSIACRLKGLHV